MFPVYKTVQRQPLKPTYICLSCRFRSRKREEQHRRLVVQQRALQERRQRKSKGRLARSAGSADRAAKKPSDNGQQSDEPIRGRYLVKSGKEDEAQTSPEDISASRSHSPTIDERVTFREFSLGHRTLQEDAQRYLGVGSRFIRYGRSADLTLQRDAQRYAGIRSRFIRYGRSTKEDVVRAALEDVLDLHRAGAEVNESKELEIYWYRSRDSAHSTPQVKITAHAALDDLLDLHRAGAETGVLPDVPRDRSTGYIVPIGRTWPPSNVWRMASMSYRPFVTGVRQQSRLIHSSPGSRQQAMAVLESDSPPPQPPGFDPAKQNIRAQLRQWQELHGHKKALQDDADLDQAVDADGVMNNLTRLPPEGRAFNDHSFEEEEERQAEAHFMRSSDEDADGVAIDTRWLRPGDLVELEFKTKETESIVAVFVRASGKFGQFFTMHGRWVYLLDRWIQYSVPGWISTDLIDPIIPYLPESKTFEEIEELAEKAYMEDLTVPRSAAAPLISKMVQFHTQSLEMYRRHASVLDDAHNILSHDTDLRYGSLTSAATTLLNLPRRQLSDVALFTVRKALNRAGFGFNVDARSHRMTGYIQIRSKQQVSLVAQVRGWIRDWQDDLARQVTTERQGRKRAAGVNRTSETANYIYGFLEKAKAIVMKSREDRDMTPCGNIGPSKKRFPITPEEDSMKLTLEEQFNWQDWHILRFMETWACVNGFLGFPRLQSLPPLLLQGTGLYTDLPLSTSTGILFLQELGTLMPHENRVRFDEHLLLPSSQHSRPLQQLQATLASMKTQKSHHFADSMQDIRHDWQDLPVYCVDNADAKEIDDGISIERAGSDQWWVHVHIANPTAFFGPEHQLARMARHMGETIYLPERAHAMLPPWVSQDHFSLGNDRPCLTVSVKLDLEGNTLDQQVRPGIVRNVVRLTPEEVGEAIGARSRPEDKIVITIGGEVPPNPQRQSPLHALEDSHAEALKTLYHLADKRKEVRKRAGGIFFDMHRPDVEVWTNWKAPGLGWEHPYRKGARRVEGDPVIRVTTKKTVNWFQPGGASANVLVQEFMLLACDTAGSWCAQRQIPALFRGSVKRPDTIDSATFVRDILEPAARESSDGVPPLHLGIAHLQTLGGTTLQTTPFRHRLLGLDSYCKATSPLRRYADMILHWQIEAGLREEARTGRSLVTNDPKADRSFLPFSHRSLNSIMLGLQPREKLITSAKAAGQNFWINMLLFRAFHFNEGPLPFYTEAFPTNPDSTTKPLMRVFLSSFALTDRVGVTGICLDMSIQTTMLRPEKYGLEPAQYGDVWECEVEEVNVYRRNLTVRPVRLAHREERQVPEEYMVGNLQYTRRKAPQS